MLGTLTSWNSLFPHSGGFYYFPASWTSWFILWHCLLSNHVPKFTLLCRSLLSHSISFTPHTIFGFNTHCLQDGLGLHRVYLRRRPSLICYFIQAGMLFGCLPLFCWQASYSSLVYTLVCLVRLFLFARARSTLPSGFHLSVWWAYFMAWFDISLASFNSSSLRWDSILQHLSSFFFHAFIFLPATFLPDVHALYVLLAGAPVFRQCCPIYFSVFCALAQVRFLFHILIIRPFRFPGFRLSHHSNERARNFLTWTPAGPTPCSRSFLSRSSNFLFLALKHYASRHGLRHYGGHRWRECARTRFSDVRFAPARARARANIF